MSFSRSVSVVCSLTFVFFLTNAYNLDTKFPIIFKGIPGSYFGFTVALHRNRDGPMALVGAPRANSSVLIDLLYEPGVLYRCSITDSNCEEVVLERKGNTQHDNRNSNFSYVDKKDGMWLGVSLDVLQNSVRNDIVTCGHLWKNQLYQKHYLANGVCYVINGDLDTNPSKISKLLPFVDKSQQSIIPPGIYKYAFGQVGTSAAFSEDGKHLLLGAPGYFDWMGTVVSYPLNPGTRYQEYTKHAVPHLPPDHSVTPESYIGYSVTSGKFFEGEVDYVAVGAPRDGGFHGRVYVYEPIKSGQEKKIIVNQRKEGSQLGEYFGASLLGVNINDDAYTDLLVGAPLYSSDSGVDEGKVYVFLSNGMGLWAFAELFGNGKSYSRFGTALANIGDINQDGYNDIAVGAPYEDGKGVVYIYHGSAAGLNVEYTQRIAAVDIDPSLSGFGISISRGFDIDLNQYPDIAVGAYTAASAVLFRTKPVIQLSAKMSFSPKQINMNDRQCFFQEHEMPCVNVTFCLWYAGKHVPLNLDFQHAFFVEHTSQYNPISPRGFFVQNGRPTTSIMQHAKLEVGRDYCITQELYIRHDIKDVITPIQLLYQYQLVGGALNIFDKLFPSIDPLTSNNISSPITFQTGCGTDDKCLSDLSLTISFLEYDVKRPFIIGEKSALSLVIEVANLGEPAFLSELFIYLPPELPSINQDICSSVTDQIYQRQNASLICDLGNPLVKGKPVKITIKLDMTKISTDKTELALMFEALTASTDINPSDNQVKIPLQFKAIADISITGSPFHEQIPYNDASHDTIPISISHTYFVMNHGPSPVQGIDITLFIPTSFQNGNNLVDFVTFTSLESDSGKPLTIPAKCNDTYLQIIPAASQTKRNKDVLSKDKFSYQDENRTDFFESNVASQTVARQKRSSDQKLSRKRKNVVIDCETTKCMAIQCSALTFSDTRKFAKITVEVQLNLSVVNSFVDPWYRVEFITRGEVQMRDDMGGIEPKDHHPDRTSVKTTIVSSAAPPPEELANWIIFVSIGIGVFLLLIILVLLVKFGFFKREKKEKMENMKSNGDMKDYGPIEGESTESDVLN